MVRPELFQAPTEQRMIHIIEEEIAKQAVFELGVEKSAWRIFEEIIAPLHRQWADQLRVEGARR